MCLQFKQFDVSHTFVIHFNKSYFQCSFQIYVNYESVTKCNNKRNRSSHPELFCKKGVLGSFTKFTGKHLSQSVFFKSLRPGTLLKKRLWHRCFPVNFVKVLITLFWTTASGVMMIWGIELVFYVFIPCSIFPVFYISNVGLKAIYIYILMLKFNRILEHMWRMISPIMVYYSFFRSFSTISSCYSQRDFPI